MSLDIGLDVIAGSAVPDVGGAVPEPRDRRARRMPLVAGVVVAVAALAFAALAGELRGHGLDAIGRSIQAMPTRRLLLAAALTALSFGVVIGIDALALRYAGQRLAARRVALASFVGCAFSQLLGFAALTGGAVRYRLWTSWGVDSADVARGVAFSVVTTWLGLGATTAIALLSLAGTAPMAAVLPPRALLPIGATALAGVLAYLGWGMAGRRAIAVRGWALSPPGRALTSAQLVAATIDWVVAPSVLYVLLPPPVAPSIPVFLEAFLLAQLAGMLSQVPGGLGVFETVMVHLLRPSIAPPDVVAALLVYRAVYYLLPFASAVVVLAAHEGRRGALHLPRAVRIAAATISAAVPDVLGVLVFASGIVLLVSGATPAVAGRLAWLSAVLPLSVIELSHFMGSVLGVALLVVARGLYRRLDAAWHLAVAALAAGIVASLLKGGDVEEALVLAAVLAVVVPARRRFHRRAALTAEPWSRGWIGAVALVVAGSIALGFFAYRNVAYSGEMWWQFTFEGDAPRFLRAAVASVALAIGVALARLVRPASVTIVRPSAAEVGRALSIVERTGRTGGYLAALGDKSLLFDGGDAFLMYGTAGRSWVALGDPVGEPAARSALAWRFRELAARHDGWPVFYEVGRESLPLCIEMGLSLMKLGEEARVPLESFSLEGGGRKGLRRTVRDVEREGCGFEVLPPDAVEPLLPRLAAVSEAWLAEKRTREKSFSLGRFDASYLRRFPLAIVRRDGEILAFANVWPSAAREELSADLMRYSPGAPHGVMEYLVVQLMLWGRAEGYRWFNLGMAPLSGLVGRALAPLWSRIGVLLYRHGERFYNFRGLRQYKEKFDPVWEPRYLASPGGLTRLRVLLDIAALVSGGAGGVVGK
jgi:phosphatidylglycerol lysyltransferase